MNWLYNLIHAPIKQSYTTSQRRNRAATFFCINAESFPPNALSLIVFKGYRFAIHRGTFDSTSRDVLFGTNSPNGIHIAASNRRARSCALEWAHSGARAPSAPLRMTLKLPWMFKPGKYPKSRRVSNIILLTFSFKTRLQSNEVQLKLLKESTIGAAKKACHSHPSFFSHPIQSE